MRGKKLFKRIAAVVTTVAMMASMGVTAFAVDTPEQISIDSVTITDVQNVAGAYNVAVSYTTTVDNVIGITMLSYTGTSAEGGALTDKPVGSITGAAYDTKYQIVGIDQINASGAPVAATGTFNFVITNGASAVDNAIAMAPGEIGYLMLGGDAVTTPAAYAFKAPYSGAITVDAVGTKSDYNAATAVADITALLEGKIKIGGVALNVKSVTVTGYDNNVATCTVVPTLNNYDYAAQTVSVTFNMKDPAELRVKDGASSIEVDVRPTATPAQTATDVLDAFFGTNGSIQIRKEGTEDAWVAVTADEMTVAATASGTALNAADWNEQAGTDYTVTVNKEGFNPETIDVQVDWLLDNWEAETVALTTSSLALITQGDDASAQLPTDVVGEGNGIDIADLDEFVKTQIGATAAATFANATKGYSLADAAATVVSVTRTSGDAYDPTANDQSYTYEVVLTPSDSDVSCAATVKATYTVTASAEDDRWEITGVKLNDTSNTIEIEYAEAPVDNAAFLTKVAELVNTKGVKATGAESAITDVVSTVTVALKEGQADYVKPAEDATEDVVRTLIVTVPATENAGNEVAKFGTYSEAVATFELTVTVKCNVPFVYGDITTRGTGLVEMDDVLAAFQAAMGTLTVPFDEKQQKAADVTGTNLVEMDDVLAIFQLAMGTYAGPELPNK